VCITCTRLLPTCTYLGTRTFPLCNCFRHCLASPSPKLQIMHAYAARRRGWPTPAQAPATIQPYNVRVLWWPATQRPALSNPPSPLTERSQHSGVVRGAGGTPVVDEVVGGFPFGAAVVAEHCLLAGGVLWWEALRGEQRIDHLPVYCT